MEKIKQTFEQLTQAKNASAVERIIHELRLDEYPMNVAIVSAQIDCVVHHLF